jgi:hypothetical protein
VLRQSATTLTRLCPRDLSLPEGKAERVVVRF